MDIQCQNCGEDFLFYESEYVRPECNHLLHQMCLENDDDFCMGCQRDVDEDETVNPVTWEELLRLCDECSQLQSIFADHVAEVAATDRSDPIVWMNTLTKAVTKIAYPSILVDRMVKGINSYRTGTESLYSKDENDLLINFGIPVRYNEETVKTINAVRRCIKELNKWMETELASSYHLQKWTEDLWRIFPNLNIFSGSQSVKPFKKNKSSRRR